VVIAEAGIVAVTWLAVTKVVVWAVPFQFTIALVAKLLPLTVKVKAAPPAVMLLGASCEMFGVTPATAGVVAFEL
jgi:hypothetical protein